MLEDDATALLDTLLSEASLTLPSALLPLSHIADAHGPGGPVVTLQPIPGAQPATGLPPLPPPASQATPGSPDPPFSGFTWFDIAPNMGSPMSMPADLAGLLASDGGAGGVQPPPLPQGLPLLQGLQPGMQQQPQPQHQQPQHQHQHNMRFDGMSGLEQQQQEVHQAAQLGSRGGGGRKGGGRGSRSAADQEEERRARNRATQARFREKQKAKQQAVHHTHSSLEADLEQARSEQQELSTEHEVLQKTLHFRDAALASLDSQSQLQQPSIGQGQPTAGLAGTPDTQQQQQQAGVGAAPLARQPSALGSGGRLRLDWSRSGSDLCAGAGLSSAVAEEMERMGSELPAHMAQLSLPVSAHPDEAMAVAMALSNLSASTTTAPRHLLGTAGSSGSGSSGGGSSGGQQAGAVVAEGVAAWGAVVGKEGAQETADDQRQQQGSVQGMEALMQDRPDLVDRAMRISQDEFVAAWRENSGALRDVLEEFDATQSEGQLGRILHLLRDFSVLMGMVMRLRPECAQALFATCADAPADMWGSVAARVEPTPAQRTALRQLWHLYMGRLTTLRAERAAALEAVQHAAQHSSTAMPAALPTSSLTQLMSGYLALFDAAGRLSTLRDEEFVAMLQLLGRMGLVLSPVQKARIAALAWPHFPDVVAITRLLVQEHEGGDPKVEELQRPGAQPL